jgi:hypothetical protein
MTVVFLWGVNILAFGPPAVFFVFYVVRFSTLLLGFLCAAFSYYLSLLAASIAWWCVPALRGVLPFSLVLSVLSAEVARYGLLHQYVLADGVLASRGKAALPRPSNDFAGALSLGLGFGIMASVMTSASVLSTAGGDGAWYRLPQCPALNAHVLTAGSALLLCLLHTLSMPLALDAWRRLRPQSIPPFLGEQGKEDTLRLSRLLIPGALHLVFAHCALLTQPSSPQNACKLILPLQGVCVALALALSCLVWRSADFAGWRQVQQWETRAHLFRGGAA